MTDSSPRHGSIHDQFRGRIGRAVSQFLYHCAGEGLDPTRLDGTAVLHFKGGEFLGIEFKPEAKPDAKSDAKAAAKSESKKRGVQPTEPDPTAPRPDHHA